MIRVGSIFSSDKAESGNKLDRGRKLGRWGREKTRKKKKKNIRKFNQIRTNGICFSVSPTPTYTPSGKSHTRAHTHTRIHSLWQAPASTTTYCRSSGALLIPIQRVRSFLCLHRKYVHLQFRCVPIQLLSSNSHSAKMVGIRKTWK